MAKLCERIVYEITTMETGKVQVRRSVFFPAFGHVLFLVVINFTQGRLHQVVNITAKIKSPQFCKFPSICR